MEFKQTFVQHICRILLAFQIFENSAVALRDLVRPGPLMGPEVAEHEVPEERLERRAAGHPGTVGEQLERFRHGTDAPPPLDLGCKKGCGLKLNFEII